VGLAISDPSATLARSLTTLTVTSAADAVDRAVAEASWPRRRRTGCGNVGMFARPDGSPTGQTEAVTEFMAALKVRVPVLVVGGDERQS
jgi:RNase H-fold protein (predicted Holliday junction resolvase)